MNSENMHGNQILCFGVPNQDIIWFWPIPTCFGYFSIQWWWKHVQKSYSGIGQTYQSLNNGWLSGKKDQTGPFRNGLTPLEEWLNNGQGHLFWLVVLGCFRPFKSMTHSQVGFSSHFVGWKFKLVSQTMANLWWSTKITKYIFLLVIMFHV